MSDLIVVTGPPGAGESTVARILSEQFDPSALVLGDDFFAMITQGLVDPWTDEARHQNEIVVGAAAAAAGRLAAGGYTVVYDGVINPWFLGSFFAATGLSKIDYLMLLPPEAICVERVRARTGHGLPDLAATRRMYDNFAGAGIAGRHVVRSNASAVEVTALVSRLIADRTLLWSPGRSEDDDAPGSL